MTRRAAVSAEPARRHVRALMAAGIGAGRVAELAGVSPSTVSHLLYQSSRHRVLAETAQRLLTVKAGLDSYRDRSQVDGTITRRKLEALIAIGWDGEDLSHRLGIRRQHVWLMLSKPTVSARRARLVRDLYERLWNSPPVVETVEDRVFFARSLRLAEAKGYRKPMDWDDIDDLSEQPLECDPTYVDEVAVRRVVSGAADPSSLTGAERLAAARALYRKDSSIAAVQRRFGMSFQVAKKAVA